MSALRHPMNDGQLRRLNFSRRVFLFGVRRIRKSSDSNEAAEVLWRRVLGKAYRPRFALVETVNKRVVVKINDVGPLKPGRIIDQGHSACR